VPSLRPLVFLTALLVAGPAVADPELRGQHAIESKRDDGRRFRVDLRVEARPSGELRLLRVARSMSPDDEDEAPLRWRAMSVERRGNELSTTYYVPCPRPLRGASAALRTGSLGGARRVWSNRIRARYRFQAGRVSEELENLTRYAPEAGWKRERGHGANLAQRLRLGFPARVPSGGRMHVLVPASGELRVKLTGGSALRLRVEDSRGRSLASTADVLSGVSVSSPKPLGLVSVVVTQARGARVCARLRQARALPRAKLPWRPTSYYPIFEFEGDGTPSTDTLYRRGGPLARFDRAFGLEGDASSVAWERGDVGVRASTHFSHGHYVRTSEPREEYAEYDWHADLDGDGSIGRGRGLSALDTNRDGVATKAELLLVAGARALEGVFRAYDHDRDGKIHLGRELAPHRGATFDGDGDGTLSPTELRALVGSQPRLRAQLERRRRLLLERLLIQDEDGDDGISATEIKPGAWDFVDDEDRDKDEKRVFDLDNLILHLTDGRRLVGNRLLARGQELVLMNGPRRHRPVANFKPEALRTLRQGSDGDFDDETDVSWWGHCDAAALAGMLFREPTRRVVHKGVTFRVSDLKALLVEYSMGARQLRGFSWKRGNELRSPADYTLGFHTTLREALAEGRPLLADVGKRPPSGGDHEVWNHAIHGYAIELSEAEGDDPYALDTRARIDHGEGSILVRYRLHFDRAGRIRADDKARTAWRSRDGGGQLVYLRYLYVADRFAGGNSQTRNPQVTKHRLAQLFGGELPWR
jgi:hypothetical protein